MARQKYISKAMLKRIGTYLVRSSKRAISIRKWDGVNYDERQDEEEYDHPMLKKTGKMYNSIRIGKIGRNSVTIMCGAFYALFHNSGTKNMPQRRFIGISRRNEKEIKKIAGKELEKTIDKLLKKALKK